MLLCFSYNIFQNQKILDELQRQCWMGKWPGEGRNPHTTEWQSGPDTRPGALQHCCRVGRGERQRAADQAANHWGCIRTGQHYHQGRGSEPRGLMWNLLAGRSGSRKQSIQTGVPGKSSSLWGSLEMESSFLKFLGGSVAEMLSEQAHKTITRLAPSVFGPRS